LTLAIFRRTLAAYCMAKVNSKKSANGSALDFEAQLWATAGWHTTKFRTKSLQTPPLAE
jgi:hypothetical protein